MTTEENKRLAKLVKAKFEGKYILHGDGLHDDSEAFDVWSVTPEPKTKLVWSTGEPVVEPIIFKRFWIPGSKSKAKALSEIFGSGSFSSVMRDCEFSNSPNNPFLKS
ncbi:hypothetical protein CLV58_11919 [Spirosoma oryzae]|uniref:Uncharacterized protein n=1 Tax=Spirosoma oryzae TaxID=1469603 RepID=A0A2T0SKD7_9BACT|nr:hypothetical protein [Spirosoma oryzae]PRY33870.1 hypothetical protein CLV58_11919 [Spirosoma oryzae]